MIKLTKFEAENKMYVNDKLITLDKNTIVASDLLELAIFRLVYDSYLTRNKE